MGWYISVFIHIHQLKFMNVCMHYLFSYNHNEDLLGVHYVLVHYSVPEDIRGLMDALN